MCLKRPTETSKFDGHVHGSIHGHPQPCGNDHCKLSRGNSNSRHVLVLVFSRGSHLCRENLTCTFRCVYKWQDGCRLLSSTRVNIKSKRTYSVNYSLIKFTEGSCPLQPQRSTDGHRAAPLGTVEVKDHDEGQQQGLLLHFSWRTLLVLKYVAVQAFISPLSQYFPQL